MKNKKILIVEDTLLVLHFISDLLENEGYEVIKSTSGENALEILNSVTPDLILLEIVMPKIDGFETCKRLKNNEDIKNIPIIFISSINKTTDKVKVFNLGAVDYVTKPIQPDELLARVNTHLTINQLQKELKEANENLNKKVKERTIKIDETNKKLLHKNTELTNALSELKESEERLSVFMNSATDSFYLLDKQLNFIAVNRNGLEIIGKPEKEVVGKNITEIVPGIKKSGRYDEHMKVLKTGKPFIIEDFIPHPVFGDKHFLLKSFKAREYLGVILTDITDRKKASNEIKKEKEFSDLTINAINDTFFVFNPANGKAIRWNNAFEKISGYSRNEIQKMKAPDSYYSEEDLNKAAETINKVIKGETPKVEIDLICKNKNKIPFEYQASIINDEKGNPKYIISIGRDITERRRAEKNLKESETRFNAFMNYLPAAAFIKDIDGKTLYINKYFNSVLGSSEDWIGKKTDELFPKEIAEAMIKDDRKALEEGYKVKEETLPDINGNIKTFQTHKFAIKLYENVKALGGFAIDISKQKKAEQALIESEERFRLLIENIPTVTWVTSQEGKTIYVSPNIEEVYGYTQEEIAKGGKELWFGRIHPDDVGKVKSEYQKLFIKDNDFNIEYRIKRKDGKWIWLHDRANIFQKQGEMLYAYGVFSDITREKQAERALKESENRFKSIFNQSPIGIGYYDKDGICIEINQVALEIFGISDNKYASGFKLFEDPNILEELLNEIKKGNTISYRSEFDFELVKKYKLYPTSKKGKIFTNVVISPFYGQNNQLLGYIGQVQNITDQLLAEKAIKESEERFKKLSGIAFEGIMIHDKGICVEINKAICKITGYNREELINQHVFSKLVKPEYLDLVSNKIKDNYDKPFEMEIINKKGKTIPIEVIAKEIIWNGKKMRVGAIRDITERKEAERALVKERQELKLIIDSSPIIIFYKDKNGKFIRVNKTFSEALNMPEENFIGKTVFDLYSSEIAEDMTSDDQEVLNKLKAKLNIIEQYESAHGIRWVQTDKIPIFDENNIPFGLIGFAQDITERKQTEQSLKDSEAKYRQLFESNVYLTYITDIKGNILLANESAAKFFGYTKETIVGKSFFSLRPDRAQIYQDVIDRIVLKGETIQFETLYPAANEDKWLFVTVSPLKYDNEIKLQIITQDITKRKKAEAALIESEEKFRLIFNSVADAVLILDMQGNFIEVNEVAIKRYGYTRVQFLTMTPKNILPDHIQHIFPELFNEIINKGHVIAESEHIYSNEKIIPVEINARKTSYKGKEAIITVVRDITERKQKQNEIYNAVIKAEENERSLLAKDLHDGISPLLSTIKIYTQTLDDDIDEKIKAIAHEKIGLTLDEAIAGIKEISNNLSPHILHNFGFVAAIKTFIDKLKGLKEINIKFSYNLDERFDEKIEITIYRVIVELVNNTLKHAKASSILIKFSKKKNEILVNYLDNGKGFKVDNMLKKKKGMGLYNIINRIEFLKGTVTINSENKDGTLVEIRIPINGKK